MARGYFSRIASLIIMCVCAPAHFVIELAREPLSWAFGIAFSTIKTVREPAAWTPAAPYIGAQRSKTSAFLARRLERASERRGAPLNVGIAGAGLAFG